MTKWLALDNISLPRLGDPEKLTDMVPRGETFERTEKEVEGLLRPRMGPPRIIKAVDQAAAPTYRPRDLSGSLRGPNVMARPDPKGSSTIRVMQGIPELTDPQAGEENDGESLEQGAIDLPPGTRVTAGAGV